MLGFCSGVELSFWTLFLLVSGSTGDTYSCVGRLFVLVPGIVISFANPHEDICVFGLMFPRRFRHGVPNCPCTSYMAPCSRLPLKTSEFSQRMVAELYGKHKDCGVRATAQSGSGKLFGKLGLRTFWCSVRTSFKISGTSRSVSSLQLSSLRMRTSVVHGWFQVAATTRCLEMANSGAP